jgi:hypothetical protein
VSVGCASGAYCDQTQSPAACRVGLKAAGQACLDDYECQSNDCMGGTCF